MIEPPNLYRGPYHHNDPQAGKKYLELACQELDKLEQRGHKPAAVMIDMVWDSNGPLVAPDDYVLGLCAEIRKRGGIVIADEVQSGYCRSGQDWWTCNIYGFKPDILTCGKPMGAGHPLALMATTRDIADNYSRQYHYFNTFGGNPVSAAVGCKTRQPPVPTWNPACASSPGIMPVSAMCRVAAFSGGSIW